MGLNCNWKELDIPKSNIVILDDIRKVNEWNSQSLEEVMELGDKFKPPLIFISNHNHIYTTDPNKSTLIATFDCNYEWFKKWEVLRCRQRGNDYEDIKNYFTEQTMKIITKKFPKIEEHLDVCMSASPLSVKHFLGYQKGETYGIGQNEKRYLEYYDTFVKNCPVKNLQVCGQDAFFSHGITPAIYSTLFSCQKVIGINFFDKAEKAVKIIGKKNLSME